VVRFTPQGIARLCWSLSKMLHASRISGWVAGGSSGSSGSSLRAARVAAARCLHQCCKKCCSCSARSAAAAAQLQFYSPQEVSNLLGACSRLQVQQQSLTAAALHYITSNAHLLQPKDTAELLVWLTQLQDKSAGGRSPVTASPARSVDPAVLHALAHRVQHTAGGLNRTRLLRRRGL